jgi:hypothetical protein
MSTTIYDICKQIPVLKDGKFDVFKHRTGEAIPTVVDGLKPRQAPTKEGLHTFTPEELLTLRVPMIEANSRITGYQRPFDRNHARKIAVAILEGRPMPPGVVALDGHGVMYAVDMQHRAVAAVITRQSMPAVVTRMTKEEQRELFAGQRKAKTVDRNVLILAASGPYEEYIQDAVTSNDHPWSEIVSANPSTKTRITPHQMFGLLANYVGNSAGNVMTSNMLERWDENLADGMAPLIACFGNKKTNPLAFRPVALRGIGRASMYVFRRNETVQESDHERWVYHMPKFAWERYLHVRSGNDFAYHLVTHWNKRLHASRKVTL